MSRRDVDRLYRHFDDTSSATVSSRFAANEIPFSTWKHDLRPISNAGSLWSIVENSARIWICQAKLH